MEYWWKRVEEVSPTWTGLRDTCREAGVEVMYTVIQSLTADGRDQSLDYKISGFHVPPGSFDAHVRGISSENLRYILQLQLVSAVDQHKSMSRASWEAELTFACLVHSLTVHIAVPIWKHGSWQSLSSACFTERAHPVCPRSPRQAISQSAGWLQSIGMHSGAGLHCSWLRRDSAA